ncbi:MAG: calcineurin-like phosphoesterase family protein [Fimbriimonadaceae bacterium]|nr:MAG: calcineurin-like phosphoesterase family protein [Fimbriimonadaceae bacterium]
MFRRDFLKGTAAVLGGLTLTKPSFGNLIPSAQNVRYVEGYVFHDRNGNGKREPGDEGIANVCVSNGLEVVETDRTGKYRLPITDDSIIFVIKPSGYSVPVDKNNLPQYHYVHKPNGSPATKHEGVKPTGPLPKEVNFALRQQKEDNKFRAILFGDPQPRNQTEIDYMSHDVIEQCARDAAAVDAKFGISLGDEMFDNLQFYDALNSSIATIGLPWYNTVGNHDMNYDTPNDLASTETFQRIYGPTYYAFNYAKVHFIVLDDVVFHGQEQTGYHGEITQKQLDFVKNDLAYVPTDNLVVVAMHIPILDVNNCEALFRLLENRPHCFSMSAHTHVQQNLFIGADKGWRGSKPHHHLNHATVCGCWWGGAPDERGIPHATMSDGAPNGYSIAEFDGNKYTVTFRPASRPENEQMAIFIPETVKSGESADVMINIFAGSTRSKVEMRLNKGNWQEVPHSPAQDPYMLKIRDLEISETPPPGRKTPSPSVVDHMWKGSLPTNLGVGLHLVEVRTTDMYGQTYSDQRTFRVE